MIQHHQLLRVSASKSKCSLLALLGIALGGMFAAVALGVLAPNSDVERIIGVLLTVVMLVGITRAIHLVLSPYPLLILEHDGIRVEPGLFGDQLIPWSQVRSVTLRSLTIGIGPLPWAPRHWLRFAINDAERFRQRQTRTQKILGYIWRTGYMVRGEMALNSGITSASLESVYRLMITHRHDLEH